MKRALIACALAAFATAAISLKLVMPTDAQQRYYQAHNEVERIAFRKDGTEELQKAVTRERIAEKELFVVRDLGRRLLWVSAALSGATLLLVVLAPKRNQSPSGS